MFFCAMPAAANTSFSSFRFVSAMFTTRNVKRHILSFRLRTAFFCSSIFILSRSVIFRLIVFMASVWSILWICRLTITPVSKSRISDKIRSFNSGARISRNETAPILRPMRKYRPSPKRKEDGAIKSFVESPDGASHEKSKANCPPSGWKMPCSILRRS